MKKIIALILLSTVGCQPLYEITVQCEHRDHICPTVAYPGDWNGGLIYEPMKLGNGYLLDLSPDMEYIIKN